MTPDRLEWLEGIAKSGRKTVAVSFFEEALADARELLRLKGALEYLNTRGRDGDDIEVPYITAEGIIAHATELGWEG